MPAGRNTDYTPEIVEKAREYITEYPSQGDKIPSIVGLCKYINKSRTCILRWGTEEGKEKFKYILEEINETQQQVLLNNGLDGTFNSNITKLVLGKHNYHERTEHSGPEGKPIPVVAVDMTADEAANIYNDIID